MQTPENTHTQLRSVLADLAHVLDDIPAESDTAPTPCDDWDVAALRSHVVGWLTAFTDGFEATDGLCSDAHAVTVEGRGGDQVRALATRLDAVLPEATARPLVIGEDGLPGEMALSMILWEYQMHGWDLARATGRPWHPEDDGVEASLEFATGMLAADGRDADSHFGPVVEVDADAPAFDRLLGHSGRDPQWAAG